VGGGAKIGHILSSVDGGEWTELPKVKGRVATIAFGRARFVAAHDSELLYSTDGATFTPGGKLPWAGSVHARRSACGDTEAGFRFVIVGEIDLATEKTRVSWRGATADGTAFVHTDLDAAPARDIAYGGGRFVVVGPAGLIESSHDGQTWQRHETGASDDFSRVVWTGQRFVVSGGTTAWTSADALTWKADAQRIPCSLSWAREPSLASGPIALGVSWGGTIHLTTDWITWQKVAVPRGPSFEAVAFGEN
jgi:hypothetical protein